ncbi:MAG TPA: 3-deoxy-manno-octulosonate cytidylyltransferase [Gemmatimonadaceae bacterium]|nr:3-deoxy-manno-octulosonate cytidylyltransferase [Gemmatimonadaceae bacterium]
MSTLAVIPARLSATRLPRKPLRLLAGVPIVIRVWQRVIALDIADRCLIATDSPEVQRAAHDAGAECMITRDDHPSGTDRVAEVVSHAEYGRFDVVLNVQGDEPFISGAALEGAVGCVADGRFELGTAAAHAPITVLETPNVVKVVCADDGRALYFSRAGIPALRDTRDRAVLEGTVRQHIGVYAYTPQALRRWVALPEHPLERIERLEQLRPLAAGMAIGVATIGEAPPGGVDTEDDLTRANENWTHLSADVK